MSVPIGITGTISVSTKGKDGPGKVTLDLPNQNTEFFAYSDQPIPSGTLVVVYGNARGGRAVDVEPINP